MMFRNPALDERLERFRLPDDFVGVSPRGYIGTIVVDLVALPAADLEIIGQRPGDGTNTVRQRRESCHVVTTRLRVEPKASTGQRHLGKKQRGPVCGREPSVVGDGRGSGVAELNLHGFS